MYRALYRKWRPQRFEDVVAQRGIVTALRNQVASGLSLIHIYFLGGQSFGHNGLSFVGLGGGNGHALGLIDAALGSLFDGVGGDGSAGVAIHLAGLCIRCV